MTHVLVASKHGPTTDVSSAFAGRNGEDYPQTGPNVWVNPTEWGATGVGPPNVQQFQTGATNNVVIPQSSEQGRGVGPERFWPHYPHAQQFNPFRNLGVFQRAGMDSYSTEVYRPESTAYWGIALHNEMSVLHMKQRSAASPVLNQPDSSSYTAVVASNNYYANPYAAGYTPA